MPSFFRMFFCLPLSGCFASSFVRLIFCFPLSGCFAFLCQVALPCQVALLLPFSCCFPAFFVRVLYLPLSGCFSALLCYQPVFLLSFVKLLFLFLCQAYILAFLCHFALPFFARLFSCLLLLDCFAFLSQAIFLSSSGFFAFLFQLFSCHPFSVCFAFLCWAAFLPSFCQVAFLASFVRLFFLPIFCLVAFSSLNSYLALEGCVLPFLFTMLICLPQPYHSVRW